MISVLMQRLLGFEPLLVAWAQMLPNLIYGAAVLIVGRLSDRLPLTCWCSPGCCYTRRPLWATAASMRSPPSP